MRRDREEVAALEVRRASGTQKRVEAVERDTSGKVTRITQKTFKRDPAAYRRAEALLSCGRCAVAVGPTNALVVDGGGRALTRRRSCRHRFCEDCSRRRATVLCSDLSAAIERLREDPYRHTWWDGRIRKLELTRWDPEHSSFTDERRALLKAWKRLRSMFPQLHTSFACLEMTYNKERDSAHPHLHIIVLCKGKLDRTALLGAWQEINGYVVDFGRRKGSQGGVHIKEKPDIKEAVKYCVKGLAATLTEDMPELRAYELLDSIKGVRFTMTYGRLFGRICDDDSVDDENDVLDELVTDLSTGEILATTTRAAKSHDVRKVSWSFSGAAVEAAREWLYQQRARDRTDAERSADQERLARAMARRRRRHRDRLLAARWLRYGERIKSLCT